MTLIQNSSKIENAWDRNNLLSFSIYYTDTHETLTHRHSKFFVIFITDRSMQYETQLFVSNM